MGRLLPPSELSSLRQLDCWLNSTMAGASRGCAPPSKRERTGGNGKPASRSGRRFVRDRAWCSYGSPPPSRMSVAGPGPFDSGLRPFRVSPWCVGWAPSPMFVGRRCGGVALLVCVLAVSHVGPAAATKPRRMAARQTRAGLNTRRPGPRPLLAPAWPGTRESQSSWVVSACQDEARRDC